MIQVNEAVAAVTESTTCYHCGSLCEETLHFQDKKFCCQGCRTVFEILHANDLCEYYSLDKTPGMQLKNISDETFAYLDEKDIRKKVVSFDADNFVRVEFYVPAVHCVSCIWLLENLQKLKQGIVKSEVNFARKTVKVDFISDQVKLSEVAALLATVGYTPKINLESEAEATSQFKRDTTLVTKLAVAGFCFGNIMLFSFPEYLGLGHAEASLQKVFSYLNIALSVPVFLYSSADYYKACLRSLREKQINIDVPIAIGLLALFFRSTWDIVTGFGPGYLDSFAGLVFFLLIGRWFQSKTYQSLAFDRDFKSYFPLAVHKLERNDQWKPVVIYDLKKGDQIRVRNMEIVPADSILIDEEALIDYSFVTGESKPVKAKQSDLIYAGGRLIGKPVVLVVDKKTSQSHLTSLWNNDIFQKTQESKYRKIIDKAARRFTWIVMGIAVVTAGYWQMVDPKEMWLVLTAVLMVACPCALALAAPFTYGSMLRVFGRNSFYLKNADIIERLAAVDTIVFDKTGTVTHGEKPEIDFVGVNDEHVDAMVWKLTGYSTHPLSNLLHHHLKGNIAADVLDYREIPGKGIEGTIQDKLIKIGSASFVGVNDPSDHASSRVYVSVDGNVLGYYRITTSVREAIPSLLHRLGNKCAALLSGDNESDRERMAAIFPSHVKLLFNHGPHDKLDYIKDMQLQGKKNVLMLGDGLNDSGALKQSDVGIAVTDDTGVFTPACDGILHGTKIGSLDKFLELAKSSTVILKTGFIISFMYNAIALSFAVSGHLTPLVAAILMPISSISVVGFTSVAVNYVAKRKSL
jgi:P-type Cu+ transporter